MPLNKSPIEWCNGTVNPYVDRSIAEKSRGCRHLCIYCYVQKFAFYHARRNPAGFYPEKIDDIKVEDKTIFVESIGDLYGQWMPNEYIRTVIERCRKLDGSNTIVFLTKHPFRYKDYLNYYSKNMVLGVTIETDHYPLEFNSNVSSPELRTDAIGLLEWKNKMISIEPVMKFKNGFADKVIKAEPRWVIIGADSNKDSVRKRYNLPEPTTEELRKLVNDIKNVGISLIIKDNIARLGIEPDHFILKVQKKKRVEKKLEQFFVNR